MRWAKAMLLCFHAAKLLFPCCQAAVAMFPCCQAAVGKLYFIIDIDLTFIDLQSGEHCNVLLH